MINSTRKTSILADHKKVGSRFVPPFVQQIPDMEHVRWRVTGLPELIWLGLLDYKLGLREAAHLSITLAQSAKNIASTTAATWFGTVSSYSTLTNKEQGLLVEELRKTDELTNLQNALSSLVCFYPELPLSFIYESRYPVLNNEAEALQEFKTFLIDYSYKYGKTATLAQANSIYIAFVTGIFKVIRGSSAFENFPAIAHFPETEEARRVASSVYPTINMFMGQTVNEFGKNGSTFWANYFWNRGLQLESCSFERESNKNGL